MKSLQKTTTTLIFSSMLVLLVSCGGESKPEPYRYKPPIDQNDGWQVAHASDAEMEVRFLEDLMNKIRNDEIGFRYIDALLIAKNGQLVFKELIRDSLHFSDGWAGNQDINLHILNSVTKSFTSTLIGIAIDQQKIPSVDVAVHDYFSHKFPVDNWSEEKSRIVLEDWLTMRSGYSWNEWNVSYFDDTNLNTRMNRSADPIQFLLDRPVTGTAGETFAYSTGVSFGLGRLLQFATQQSVTEFMETYLFSPLNIKKYDYWEIGGQLHTGSSLYLSIRDAAKLGQLYLNQGMWNGVQVVSPEWISRSTTAHVDRGAQAAYGYHWWMRHFKVEDETYQTYYADGLGKQYIFVFPELSTTVAIFAHAYEQHEVARFYLSRIMQDHILPAVINSPDTGL